MVWTERWKRYDEMSIRNAIFPNNRQLRAGWMLHANRISDWRVCRIVNEHNGTAQRIDSVRDCSQKEMDILNDLLWTTQICLRYKAVLTGNPWGLACLD
jgi:hypothetical protein